MVCGNLTSVCGWQNLMDADLIGAAFNMYDAAFVGWTIGILFILYQVMLLLKTKNLTLSWTTGVLFLALYAASGLIKTASIQIMAVILILELGSILFLTFMK
jgi:hypothetical protein